MQYQKASSCHQGAGRVFSSVPPRSLGWYPVGREEADEEVIPSCDVCCPPEQERWASEAAVRPPAFTQNVYAYAGFHLLEQFSCLISVGAPAHGMGVGTW